MIGADLTWNLTTALDLRGEALRNPLRGSGYWVEAAYRLNRLGSSAFLRDSQVVARGEQYWVPKSSESAIAERGKREEHEPELPTGTPRA